MQQQHHPKLVQNFSGGANSDAGKELLGAQEGGEGKGEYLEGRNQRLISVDGKNFYSQKIGGEELFYDNVDNRCADPNYNTISGTWLCIGAIDVKGHRVEFWAEESGADPIVRIDGLIVARSGDLPFDVDHPLQLDKNESCIGGEVFITNNLTPPFILNVEDMLENSGRLGGTCTTKYFDDFNIDSFTTSLDVSPDIMVFKELVTEAGQGLKVGNYIYKLRWVDADGNRSQFCTPTPTIPVPSRVGGESSNNAFFPYSKTRGAAVDTTSDFKIRLKFRVTNLFNYTGAEIVRISYNAGQPLGFVPATELIWSIDDLAPGEINVITFTDGVTRTATDLDGVSRGITIDDEAITDEEDTNTLTGIQSAKTLRYFDNRLVLMNVKTFSRDTEGLITFNELNNEKMFPVIKKLDKAGYGDIYNCVNHKSYMRGERYGISAIPIDSRNERAFAQFISGSNGSGNSYKNYKTPNRRTEVGTNTAIYSNSDFPNAAREDGSAGGGPTHEIFDLFDAERQSDLCSFKNIMSSGSKGKSNVNSAGCPDAGHGTTVGSDEIGYTPYTPVNPNDTTTSGHSYRSTYKVERNLLSAFAYNPKGYAPNYYAQGLAISGISSYPSWVKAFAFGRTEPAGRVVAQGLGFYNMASAASIGPNNIKSLNSFVIYSPDIDETIGIAPEIFADIKANPSSYQIELVSPLGFFSDVFSGDLVTTNWRGIDMITYARILYEDGTINVGDSTSTVGKSGYVSYGKWRNSSEPAVFPSGNALVSGELRRFNILGTPTEATTLKGTTGRGKFLRVQLNSSFYNSTISASGSDFDNTSVKNWHEPLYAINIIKHNNSVQDQNINSFINTGAYQKIESIIGKGSGTQDQKIELIDERWEDCVNGYNGAFVRNAFVYITTPSGEEQRWIDITFRSIADQNTILNSIKNTGSYNGSISDNTTVVGVYKHISTSDRVFEIHFDIHVPSFSGNPELFIPEKDSTIAVKYNDAAPIKIFGGDTYIGEHMFCPIDAQGADGDGGNIPSSDDFRLGIGFPYRKFYGNPRVYIPNRTTGLGIIQDSNDYDFRYLTTTSAGIRQLAVMFSCETRINPWLFYGENGLRSTYPDVHYILRPYRWNGGNSLSQNNVYSQYATDYVDEASVSSATGRWRYGGIRFLPNTNIDYAQKDVSNVYLSKPQVGFEEKNDFCVQVIWSERRDTNEQDDPGLKTFPALNVFNLSDQNSAIQLAWSANSGRGENLYAFTENGVCLLITNQKTLHQLTGEELANIGIDEDTFISKEIWINRELGMPSEMWRSATWYDNKIYWADKDSVYMMSDNKIEDIGRLNYHTKLYSSLRNILSTDKIAAGYDVLNGEYWLHTSVSPNTVEIGSSNIIHSPGLPPFISSFTVINYPLADLGEYSLVNIKATNCDINVTVPTGFSGTIRIRNISEEDFSVNLRNAASGGIFGTCNPGETLLFVGSISSGGAITFTTLELMTDAELEAVKTKNTFVFSSIRERWLGYYDYVADKFLSSGDKMFSLKSLKTYELDKGYEINGSNVEYEITAITAPVQPRKKEFIRIGVNSNNKPEKIEFLDIDGNVLSEMSEAVFGVNYLKEYDGFENWIPRDTADPYLRRQDRLLIYKIFHSLEEDFQLINTTIQYKILK